MYDPNIVLSKLSTGEPYPAAKQSTIHVLNSEWSRPGIIAIVGDHLVLLIRVLTHQIHPCMPHDSVFVYDWRNAMQEMDGLSYMQCDHIDSDPTHFFSPFQYLVILTTYFFPKTFSTSQTLGLTLSRSGTSFLPPNHHSLLVFSSFQN